jgi:hypothetical protein
MLPNYKTNKSVTSSSSSSPEALRTKETTGKLPQVTQDISRLSLQEGQIIKGEIIDLRFNHITIRLEPSNHVVHATIEGNVPLAIGQTAQFQVVQGASEQLLLKHLPSSMQTTTEAMIAKALTASGLPLTNQNKSLVSLLLNHNMSIDMQSLRTMVNLTKRYPDANPRTLVLMQKHQIPITKENINQFEAYTNQTEQISYMINELSDKIMELLQMPSNLEHTNSAQQKNITETIGNHQNVTEHGIANVNANQPEGNIQVLHTIHNALLEILDDNQYGNTFEDQQKISAAVLTTPLHTEEQNALPNTIEQQIKDIMEPLVTTNDANASQLMNHSLAGIHADHALQTFLNEQEISNLMEHLKTLPNTQPLYNQIAAGTIHISDILNFAKSQSLSGDLNLLQSPEYSKILTEALRNKWMISPKKIGDPNNLKQLYEKIEKDMDRLRNLIDNSNETLGTIHMQEPVKNLQENLSFLKDLNQMFTYLPIPLQFKNQNAHCDLYVLSRKKALKNPKDGLTVLLSLDMENLGSINIHIQMLDKQIRAKFYLEDSSAGQLLTEHMGLLSDALQQKGYQLHTEVLDRYKKTDFIEDFIEPDTSEMDLQRYTFDVRT